MTFSDLTAVWTPTSAVLAVTAGVIYGLFIGRLIVNPTYGANIAGPRRLALITGIAAASGGLTFFALQALGSYLSGDPFWFRVMSRYGQWILFSLAIAATTWALVRRDRSRRRRLAHDLALKAQS